MTLFSFIPHAHRWHNITITRKGALTPSGRTCLATYVEARCKGCDKRLYKIYYHDITDAQARRWLG